MLQRACRWLDWGVLWSETDIAVAVLGCAQVMPRRQEQLRGNTRVYVEVTQYHRKRNVNRLSALWVVLMVLTVWE